MKNAIRIESEVSIPCSIESFRYGHTDWTNVCDPR